MNARLSLIAACTAAVLAGCSGGAAPSTQTTTPTTTSVTPPAGDPVKWAGAFCGGTTPVLTGAVELITLAATNADNPAALKEGMLKILETGSKSMAEAETKLKEIGAPGEDAKAVHDEIVKQFGTAAKEYVTVAEQMRKLDANAPDFMDQVQKLGGDSADPSKFADEVKKLDANPKYKDAIAKAPECTQMREKLGKLIGQ
ncbi:hypothetical protein UK23_12205 [Lentzea aerocolonigenes]|uniref:Lipoprotein n=1 Tax=Lentzea aerocolonigenes TaxID=68170 RepID=A0A0F0H8Q1_LENAE|nr:hypothetical protein [Lentzea aerocolonigenes]KJK49978.1 hypothetical protein UK23_12205 [Lentzea aerocolonigenes]